MILKLAKALQRLLKCFANISEAMQKGFWIYENGYFLIKTGEMFGSYTKTPYICTR